MAKWSFFAQLWGKLHALPGSVQLNVSPTYVSSHPCLLPPVCISNEFPFYDLRCLGRHSQPQASKNTWVLGNL